MTKNVKCPQISSNGTTLHGFFVFDYHKFTTFDDIFSDLVNHQK